MRTFYKVFGFAAVSVGLAACHGPLRPGPFVAPNPYGYLKKSSLCKMTPIKTDEAARKLTAQMTVQSDDGLCTLTLKKQGGGQYASFGVMPHPSHGRVLTYNYNGQTYINYRADTAFAGQDSFSVVLIPSRDAPRWTLDMAVAVQAAPITVPQSVPVAPQTPIVSATPSKKAVAHKVPSRARKTIRKKRK